MDPNQIDLKTLSATDRARLAAVMKDGWRLTPATCAVRLTGGKWIATNHLQYISTIIATEIAKGDARIIVTMPARHGKSEFLSVHTPVWFLERWPDKYVMNLSYGADLATDFSYKVRSIFENEDLHSLLRTRIDPRKKSVERWLTTKRGGLTAAGIGGTITGRGADLMLIDDYIKNAEEALSDTVNNKLWEWFKSTAYTRLEPGASLVILATRWSQNDLIERCTSEMAHENWRIIRLPAIAEMNDPLGRAEGEALWPERYDIDKLHAIRQGIGSFWWSAMYQQDPKASMAGQDLGERLRTFPAEELPHENELRTLRAWDLASTENAGDYTVGVKMSYHKKSGRIIIRAIERFQKTPRGNENTINATANWDGTGVPIWIEQEPGSAGKIVIEHFKAEVLNGFTVGGDKPTGKIEVRAGPLLADIEAGIVVAVEGEHIGVLRHELNAFPDGKHDDQISAMALGHSKIAKSKYGGVTWGRRKRISDGIVRTKRSHENTKISKTGNATFGRQGRYG